MSRQPFKTAARTGENRWRVTDGVTAWHVRYEANGWDINNYWGPKPDPKGKVGRSVIQAVWAAGDPR
jgi:hypothetical protein